MKILLPLKYYDEAGRVKPAVTLYICIGFLCRSLLVLIGSVTVRDNAEQLLALFYSNKHYLYISLAIAIPAFLTLLLLGFREKIWKADRCWMFSYIKPLLIFSVLADLALHIVLATTKHWQFSWVIAVTLILDSLLLFFLLRDKHTQLMLKDWKKTIPNTATAKPIV
ncbi:DUF2919 domain-containing protein [uncultured Paraglaciecola sp.]|uniref:DUF2919 domain-containing protein n=1 Tax=uncultured Paraglaciecola sp. TaxID=1765024 RepID=UPI0030D86AE9|tara:strand:- start:159344 stop:159844 length:501 start_codon:yes stop_codon:yes gene_type:complete